MARIDALARHLAPLGFKKLTVEARSGRLESAPPSPSRTSRYTPSNSSYSVSSIASRNSSPVKQLQTLADDVECPVTFRNFDNVQALNTEDGEVSRMQSIVRQFADGIGILEYATDAAFQAAIADIPISDRERILYPWAKRTDGPRWALCHRLKISLR